MAPPWTPIALLVASFFTDLADARIHPFVPPPQAVLEAEGVIPPPFPQPLPVVGAALPRNGWSVTADSAQDGNPASNVLDGDDTTFWHTEYSPTTANLPHAITVDMNSLNVLDGITYLPRQDGSGHGNIGEHEVYTSIDGTTFTLAAYGTWLNDNSLKSADFEPTPCRYFRIVALTEAGNEGPWSSAAELNAYGVYSYASRTGWTATADSAQDGNPASNVLDGDDTTFWHTEYSPDTVQLPHAITIDMQAKYFVNALAYNPRQDDSQNGNIGQYKISTSVDGSTFSEVASGSWNDDQTLKLVKFDNVEAAYIRLEGITEAGNRGPWSSASEINVSGRIILPRTGWTAGSDSSESGNPPTNAIDANTATFWRSEYDPTTAQLPHDLDINMQKVMQGVNTLYYLPRQDGVANGRIGEFKVFTSLDKQTWAQVTSGIWPDDATLKVVSFVSTQAQYIRLHAITEAGNRGPWSSAAEVYISNDAAYSPPPNGKGMWGPTIDFPMIPVAASVQPTTGRVVTWAAYSGQNFGVGVAGQTVTAMYDPATKKVIQSLVTNTNHDMFCPGISMDADGRTVVTGGDTSQRTSIYDPDSNSWASGSDMNIERGYQSSATCSDGRIFTIGGSWSGPLGGKNGEIFDPKTNTWTLLPGALVAPMLTQDSQGIFRQDNHAWLFAWKDGSVFQAGPSIAMNWYGTGSNGTQTGAGNRASDADSMCGNAVMYDAVAGKIFTVGGSPDYQNAAASTAAHEITIGGPGSTPQVTTLTPSSFSRIFHNSIALPDGTIFTTGGQTVGNPFYDTNPVFTPELWDPSTGQFTQLVPNSTPRVYHSFALLLEDATVMSGGGGLCDTCSANHWDAQIFTPPYLLNSDNSPAARPSITSVSDSTFSPGDTITVNTDSAVTSMSLVRYGSATHTVNTDQRRIPLTLTSAGTNSYRVTVPSDSGIAVPGYWMLFAMNSNGVPSVASTILIS